MARIRTIKPSFFRSRAVRKLSMPAKLVWIGLWPIADDAGRLIDEPSLIVGDLWALGLTDGEVNSALDELAESGRIIRYQVAGDGFIQVTNWLDHQKINKPYPSDIPAESFTDHSGNATGVFPLGREGNGIGREGNAQALTPFCIKHPTGTDSPCRACGNARRTFDADTVAVKNKPTSRPPRIGEEPAHEHKWLADGTCMVCPERQVA